MEEGMETQRISYPEVTDALKSRNIWTMLKFFGPGAIIASLTIGAGETLFASRGGAIFGYTLMWAFLISAIMKGVQVYTGMRYITLTGEHPMERWANFPGPRALFPLIIAVPSIICFPFIASGLSILLGTLTKWIAGFGTPYYWGLVYIAVGVTITLLQTYGMLEKMQTILVGFLLVCIIIATIAVKPDWLAAIVGFFVPQMKPYEPWLVQEFPNFATRPPWVEAVVYMGAIGGGTYDYIGYLGLLREKNWGILGLPNAREIERLMMEVKRGQRVPLPEDSAEVEKGRMWLKAPLIDAVISFSAVLAFTFCFVVLGAAILHVQHQVPSGLDLLNMQSQFLTMIHPSLMVVYKVGVFFAIFGTIYAAFEVWTRTTYESFRTVFPKLRDSTVDQFRPWVCAYVGGLGALLTIYSKMSGINPVALVTPAAIIGGVLTCGLWCLAMVWTDRKFLPKPYQMGKVLLVLNIVFGIAMTSFGVKALIDWAAKTF
jgi:Mn2+/Fe2+ NRAMP family transporter